jgi:hypothetical protein
MQTITFLAFVILEQIFEVGGVKEATAWDPEIIRDS